LSYKVVKFQETPNPNAVKCVLDRSAGESVRSYFSAEQAKGDALAARLFAVAGVTNVLINDGWITVNKTPEAAWKAVKAGVERALAEAVE
jgi:hypothetical protein